MTRDEIRKSLEEGKEVIALNFKYKFFKLDNTVKISKFIDKGYRKVETPYQGDMTIQEAVKEIHNKLHRR